MTNQPQQSPSTQWCVLCEEYHSMRPVIFIINASNDHDAWRRINHRLFNLYTIEEHNPEGWNRVISGSRELLSRSVGKTRNCPSEFREQRVWVCGDHAGKLDMVIAFAGSQSEALRIARRQVAGFTRCLELPFDQLMALPGWPVDEVVQIPMRIGVIGCVKIVLRIVFFPITALWSLVRGMGLETPKDEEKAIQLRRTETRDTYDYLVKRN